MQEPALPQAVRHLRHEDDGVHLNTDPDRREKAKLAADWIRASRGYRWVGIYDVDLDRGVVSNLAWSGPEAPAHPVFPAAKGITGRAIVARKTVNVGNVAQDADYLTALGSTQSEIIVPVLDASGERVIGTIDVESERSNAFDAGAVRELERFAEELRLLWR